MHLNDAVRLDIDRAVLCWLATVDPDGYPSVSPKELFCAYDNQSIIIADVASRGTMRNLTTYPKACVSFVDIFRQKGFKIMGQATLISESDENFKTMARPLVERAGGAYPVRGVIQISAEKIQRIWAPSFHLFPEMSEAERMADAYRTYGVRPIERG
ncbi:pyridoxamine 5'-phosphate oxidase family protein [Pseudovibrio exalbescens]|uniref:Pyridoxamine 5'-phosphate oxidase N-terminal domain-containing protein n=1 Tax=Pseudovibrio exalbescens TaxID=197461 RepID=A0A1U7JGL8_9HYPH|nr:pyridoxamine 5'-phosphate oxidase family protein [Pseudovibrio exalbescens]OKL43890.1 hypothetical protein A3843_11275 [Pseudovibrio exalbescens]